MSDITEPNSGRLFYLMGPSGAGKDSLLDACRGQRVAGRNLRVAVRHITRRADSGGEDHIALTSEAFRQQLDQGHFALHWRANDRHYGVGMEIEHWLAAGDMVLMNGSRAHLSEALGRYGEQLVPVLLYVDPDQQRRRLVERGRETTEEIDRRIERSRRLQSELGQQFATIRNDGTLNHATEQLMAIIRDHLPDPALAQP